MKPRLWIIDGMWVCKLRATRTGYGSSARRAYADWKWANRGIAC